MDGIRNIVFIGAGNVATNMAFALRSKGFHIVQIFSRTEQSAKELAGKVGAAYCSNYSQIELKADLYFISVPDNSIDNILSQISCSSQLIVHTSGSLSLDILRKHSSQSGVFYPLQTFSKNKIIDFRDIPVLIEGSDKNVEKKLLRLGIKLSKNVHVLETANRQKLHLAAVFACNFSNYMFSVASDILKKGNIDFDLLKPLIIETANKILYQEPREAQTGPVVRHDTNIINRHLEMLSDSVFLQKLYEQISIGIGKMNNREEA